MNKTININLAGIFFHIDEDAYLKLSHYLEAIERSFTDSQGKSEIISDIEARIAELFTERIQNQKQVVSVILVDEIITIMGQPEDYLVDNEIFEDHQPNQENTYNSKTNKKLFRDTENSYVAGVAAGLAHYINVEIIWIRLLWVILAFGSGGTFVFIYLIFWALVPEAKTTAEKLTMTGNAVNISTIEKKIKDGIDIVSETLNDVAGNISKTVKNVDFEKQGNRIKSNSQNFFDSVGSIIMLFLKIMAKFVGVILIIVGIGTLISLIVGILSVGITNAVHIPGMDFINAANAANIPIWLMSVLIFLAVGIPFFFVFYLGLKILVTNLKSIGNIAKFTLLGLWLIALIGLIITGVKQATEHAFDSKVTSKTQLNITTSDTLILRMNTNNSYYSNYSNGRRNYETIQEDENGSFIISSNIRLIVRSTKDDFAYITIDKEASGSNYRNAKTRAENINYKFSTANNQLLLDPYFRTDLANKFSNQEVTLIVYLPEGSTLFADKNTYYYHRNSSYYNDILDNEMEEHFLKVIENDLECLDCKPMTDEIINKNNQEPKNTNSFKEKLNIKINKEDGVNITINED